jgi:hypothetical protein
MENLGKHVITSLLCIDMLTIITPAEAKPAIVYTSVFATNTVCRPTYLTSEYLRVMADWRERWGCSMDICYHDISHPLAHPEQGFI